MPQLRCSKSIGHDGFVQNCVRTSGFTAARLFFNQFAMLVHLPFTKYVFFTRGPFFGQSWIPSAGYQGVVWSHGFSLSKMGKQLELRIEFETWQWNISIYPLVMTNSLPWKITMLFSSVNHLFRLGPSIPWRTVSHNQRVNRLRPIKTSI